MFDPDSKKVKLLGYDEKLNHFFSERGKVKSYTRPLMSKNGTGGEAWLILSYLMTSSSKKSY